jgi:uncharacterized membrane protein
MQFGHLAVSGAPYIGTGMADTLSRGSGGRDWRNWALLLPLDASVLHGIVPPVLKTGLAVWPSPAFAGLVGYCVSSLVVLAVERIRTERFVALAPLRGYLWFGAVGLANGLATLTLYAAVGHGRVSLVTPLIATYPIVALALSALFCRRCV